MVIYFSAFSLLVRDLIGRAGKKRAQRGPGAGGEGA